MLLPDLIIIGVFKAGTTSLFRYLAKHPDICGSSKKEIHYFTPLVFGSDKPSLSIEDYAKFFSCAQEKYRLEASPAYVYGGEKVIKRMKIILPDDHKVLLILRNPLDRFISYYKHIRSQFLIDDEFSTFVEKCIKEFYKSKDFKNGHYANAIREGLYIDYIPFWEKYYDDNLKVVFFDDLKNDPLNLMQNISQWLGIRDDFYSEEDLTVENKTIVPKNTFLHKVALLAYQMIPASLKDNKVKSWMRDTYKRVNSSIKVDYSIDLQSKKKVQEIYKPYNSKLRDYMGEIPESWIKEEQC